CVTWHWRTAGAQSMKPPSRDRCSRSPCRYPRQTGVRGSMQARRILIVEDERALALGLSDLFSAAGYAVSTAVSGEEASTLCSAERFDIVLLDVLLPGKSGF